MRATEVAGDHRGRALAAVALAQFMVTLDMTIVNVALPSMATGLHIERSQLPWVVNIYALCFGGFLLLGGRMADLYGQRRVLACGTVAFALASFGGGLAQNEAQLILARAVQGVGAAVLAPAALAVLTLTQREGRERTRALGVYAAVSAVGGGAGVLIGGLLAEYAGWRWVMLVNLPMAAGALVLALGGVPGGTFGRRRGRLDLVGAVLATAGVGLLILGVERTEQVGWGSAATLGTLAASAVLLLGFALWEQYGPMADPLIRLGLLRRRNVLGANLFMALLVGGQFGAFYFSTLYLQTVLGFSAARAGLAFLPLTLCVVVAIQISTRLMRRGVPVRLLLVPAGLLGAAGFAWWAALEPSGGYLGDVLVPSMVAGLGIGFSFVPLTAAATGGLPPQEAGTASALLNSARQIGGAIGLAVLVTAATARTDHRLAAGAEARAAATDGYSLGYLLAAGFLVAAALAAAVVLPGRPKPTAGVPAEPAGSESTGAEPAGSEPTASGSAVER
ncbi:DHA2 family efflux MFS transporter permease subunit [Kitasatospora sp. NPDC101155]|uniref:MFS transporter n=1 Tax=Kitasatospora sp. NPDC101155 TaxID=3364097 RepID=UPI00382CF45B